MLRLHVSVRWKPVRVVLHRRGRGHFRRAGSPGWRLLGSRRFSLQWCLHSAGAIAGALFGRLLGYHTTAGCRQRSSCRSGVIPERRRSEVARWRRPVAKLYMCWRGHAPCRCYRCRCRRLARHVLCAPEERGVFGQDVSPVALARVVAMVVVHQRGLWRRWWRMGVHHGVSRHAANAVRVRHERRRRLQRRRRAWSTDRKPIGGS